MDSQILYNRDKSVDYSRSMQRGISYMRESTEKGILIMWRRVLLNTLSGFCDLLPGFGRKDSATAWNVVQ